MHKSFSRKLTQSILETSLQESSQLIDPTEEVDPLLVAEEDLAMAGSPLHTPDTSKKKAPVKRRRTAEDYNQILLDAERQKTQQYPIDIKPTRKQGGDDGEDLMFFKSLLPHVNRIPDASKLIFRSRIQELVQHFAYQVPAATSPAQPQSSPAGQEREVAPAFSPKASPCSLEFEL